MKRNLLNTLCCAAVLLAAVCASAQAPADPWKEALQYKFGQPRAALTAIEDQIRGAKPEKLGAIEDRLLGLLASNQASSDCKDWVCRQLRQVGSPRAVPALAPLLADKNLSTVARLALQSIPGSQVDQALRDALPKLAGQEKTGALQTIGARRDRLAVPLLGPLAGDADPAVSEMALHALGRIGGAEALAAVRRAKVSKQLARYRFHAMLLCAEQMTEQEAAGVYASVLAEAKDPAVQVAALRGLAKTDKQKAAPAIAAALRSTNKKLRLAAVQLICEPGRSDLLAALLPPVRQLPADAQITFLTLVSDRAAIPAVLAAAGSQDEAISRAGIAALGRIGDAAVVGPLLEIAATEKGTIQAAARTSLQKLRGHEADATLVCSAQTAAPAVRAEAIRALAARGAAAALPVLLKAAADADKSLQAVGLGALGELADAKTLPALLRLLAAAKDPSGREVAQAAVVATCRRMADPEAAAAIVVQAVPAANVETRSALLAVLAQVPSAKSLAALRAALADADAGAKDAAVRGLAAWPEAGVMGDLLAIARGADRPVHKVLALRGIARLATLPGKQPSAQAAKILAEALSLANRPEEKRLVLGALADVDHPAALEASLGCLADKSVELEAATAAVRIAQGLRTSQPKAAKAAIARVLEVCQAPAARQMASRALLVLDLSANIAPQGTATSPDGLEKDGTASGDQAAIDNNPNTYWDETDGKPLYRLLVTFKRAEPVAAISITGYAHQSYAPKTFDVLCDGKPVKQVKDAQYDNNLLVIGFEPVTCTTVELKITGYYGRSPSVRELGIYRPAGGN